MNRDEIVSAMVKARECCRQVVRLYEHAREQESGGDGIAAVRHDMLIKANAALSQMLVQMKRVPDKPDRYFSMEEDKNYVHSLFVEISDLIERAMILEREVRSCMSRDGDATGSRGGSSRLNTYKM